MSNSAPAEIKIVTVGLGGAGCNIVNRLIKVGAEGHGILVR